jgi:hypothetical protein
MGHLEASGGYDRALRDGLEAGKSSFSRVIPTGPKVDSLGFPNRERSESLWQTEVCHGEAYYTSVGL